MNREIKPGMTVLVAYPPDSMINNAGAIFEGQTFTVKKAKLVRRNRNTSIGWYYELEGAVGKDDVPYGFLADELIPLD